MKKEFKAEMVLTREDLVDAGLKTEEEVNQMSDDEMQWLAEQVMDSMRKMQFWVSLRAVV
jgi:hypothetical protein